MKNDRDNDIAAELKAHLAAHVDDNVRAGMTADDARRSALLALGGIETTKERYRDQQRIPLIETCLRELRQAFARLRRSPAFTAAAVLSLALAIGANISIAAVVERVVINPLPYPASDRLIALDFAMPSRNISGGFNSMTARAYFHYADNARTLESVAVSRTEDRTLTGGGAAERVRIARTTPSLANVLRVMPAVGGWLPVDKRRGPAPVAVLSHGLWSRRYGADRTIIGRTVTLNGVPTVVVGVMPATFAYPDARVDLWIPEPFQESGDDSYSFSGVARLRDGIAIAAVRPEIDQLSRALGVLVPREGYDGIISTALTLQDATIGPITSMLWMLMASAGVVLLVACANIANLFLVRSEARQQEIAVRRALGAGTAGIAGYFFAESALLSAAGSALGFVAAWYGVRMLLAFGPASLPRLEEIHLAPIHMAFTLALAILATVVFGAVPLLRLGRSRVTVYEGGRGTTAGRRSHRARQLLMAGQVALALVLLVASGLLFRSFLRLRAVDPGFDASSTLTFQIGLPRSNYQDRQRIVAAHRSILEKLRALPGVTGVSTTNCVPLSGRGFCGGAPLFIDGEPLKNSNLATRPIVAIRPVAESYFETMGMRFVRGRSITFRDLDGAEPVAVINDVLARTSFPGEDPLGKRIRMGPHVPAQVWFTIVGVVKATPTLSLTEARPVPKMYVPMFTTRDVWPAVDVMTYVVRTSTPPMTLAVPVRGAVKEVDPNLALAQVRTLQDHLDAAAAPRAFTMILIVIAASTALLLGIVGIYGVMSYVVSQRTNEIGVRIALGADPGSVVRMIIRQGGLVALGGIAAGLTAALAGSRVIASLLYDVSPRDPAVFAATTFTLLAIALVACWLPARRAASVNPLSALRAQ